MVDTWWHLCSAYKCSISAQDTSTVKQLRSPPLNYFPESYTRCSSSESLTSCIKSVYTSGKYPPNMRSLRSLSLTFVKLHRGFFTLEPIREINTDSAT